MNYVGVDLHKKTINLCVMKLEGRARKIVAERRFHCSNPEGICKFFQEIGPFQFVVEASANYEWFFLLIESIADRCVLAHPLGGTDVRSAIGYPPQEGKTGKTSVCEAREVHHALWTSSRVHRSISPRLAILAL